MANINNLKLSIRVFQSLKQRATSTDYGDWKQFLPLYKTKNDRREKERKRVFLVVEKTFPVFEPRRSHSPFLAVLNPEGEKRTLGTSLHLWPTMLTLQRCCLHRCYSAQSLLRSLKKAPFCNLSRTLCCTGQCHAITMHAMAMSRNGDVTQWRCTIRSWNNCTVQQRKLVRKERREDCACS